MIQKINELSGFINLTVYVITVVSLYWKMRNDINLLNKKIETDNQAICSSIQITNERIDELKKDRKIKWEKYDRDKNKQNEDTRILISKIDDMGGDIKSMATDITWLKEKK